MYLILSGAKAFGFLEMRKRLIIIIVGLSVVLPICVFSSYFLGDVYNLVRCWSTTEAPGGYFSRGIGTNKDLWLNGYLGPFLRFKMFGSLNWLAFPLFIYFLVTIRSRERWEIAIWLVLSASCIFICMKGYLNYRYQFTLFPVLITIIFLFGWEVVKIRSRKAITIVLLLCTCILLITFYSLWDSHLYYYRASVGCGRPGERFPYEMIKYIEEKAVLEDDSVILECNQPILYYHTSKKGLPNGDKSMGMFYKKGASLEDAFWILRDKLKVRYILRRKAIGGRLDQIIKTGCDLVCDDQGYKLYEVKELPSNLTIEDFDKKRPDFETNFSNWMGRDQVSIKDLSKTLPPMAIQGFRGDFIFKRISSDDGNIVRVMLRRLWLNERPVIQFGFCVQPNGLKLTIEDGELVSIIMRVRLSSPKSRSGRSAQLFVQDKVDDWSGEEVYWQGSSWRDVLVSKKIREGFTNICMGIKWKPGSTDEWLDVKLVRIFVSDKDS